jgi:hypothetical protein
MDFRARSPKTTPKYPLQRGQILAIFRAIKPLPYFSGKARRLCTLYTTMRQEKDPDRIQGRVARNMHALGQKVKKAPTVLDDMFNQPKRLGIVYV